MFVAKPKKIVANIKTKAIMILAITTTNKRKVKDTFLFLLIFHLQRSTNKGPPFFALKQN